MTRHTDPEAERSVIGAALLLGSLPPGTEALRVGEFSDRSASLAWAAVLALCDESAPLDEITVKQRIEDQGAAVPIAWLSDLAYNTPTAANAGYYARIVQKQARRRDLAAKLHLATIEAAKVDCDPAAILEATQRDLASVGADMAGGGFSAMPDMVRAEFAAMQHRYENKAPTGIPTGFIDLDPALGGMGRGSLIIIAGRPGMGKTALAQAIGCNVADAGGAVQFLSLEMDKPEVMQRDLSSEARVELHRIRSGRLRDSDWPKLANAIGRIERRKTKVFDRAGSGILEVKSAARSEANKQPPDLVIVDYIQLMQKDPQNSVEEINQISRELKILARDLRCPVIALSQLNRGVESRSDHRPMLSDLRGSGGLEQDADQVMLLYREGYYDTQCQNPELAEINLAKNRHGKTGVIELRWLADFVSFRDMGHPG